MVVRDGGDEMAGQRFRGGERLEVGSGEAGGADGWGSQWRAGGSERTKKSKRCQGGEAGGETSERVLGDSLGRGKECQITRSN